MSVQKTLVVNVPSPTESRKVKLELLEVGFRVSWSSGNPEFQRAFTVDLQVGWIRPLHRKKNGSSELRSPDVGPPIWLYRFIFGFELDELRASIEREGV